MLGRSTRVVAVVAIVGLVAGCGEAARTFVDGVEDLPGPASFVVRIDPGAAADTLQIEFTASSDDDRSNHAWVAVDDNGPALAGAMAAFVLGAIAVGFVFGRDARLDLCPVQSNTVLVSFEIPTARDYAKYIPRMLRSPELEVDAPALIVIFDGPTTLAVLGAPAGIDENGDVIGPDPRGS